MTGSSYPPIGSLGATGDGHSIALFSPDGTLEWYCPLRFDAHPVFWPLLDRRRGGALRIAPERATGTHFQYVDDTAVLAYEWRTPTGRARARVCMAWPNQGRGQELLWVVEGMEGETDLDVVFDPRPAFGRDHFSLAATAAGAEMSSRDVHLEFHSDAPLREGTTGLHGRTRVEAGRRLSFRLRVFPANQSASPSGVRVNSAADAIAETEKAWREWSDGVRYEGPYRRYVLRSAITLKLLIYEPSGAVVAAATTSLPEVIGGVRNWDYRYTWLRDASFTLNALYLCACDREAHRYARWMCRATAEHGLPLRVLYGIGGEADFPEFEIEEAEGYRGSRPVRVGNAAERQLQLDSYGELLDCISICEVLGDQVMREEWPHFRRLVDFAADNWREPDSGIWEVRDTRRHFVHSKAMAWTALDRGTHLATRFGLDGDTHRWAAEADALRREVLDKGIVPGAGRFGRSYGEEELDASLLMLPIVGFVRANDQRMAATIDAIMSELNPEGALQRGLLWRYPHRAGDGLPGKEGAFTICSFWLVEALALAGRGDEAEEIFEDVCRLEGDLGLFAEEINYETGEHLGNFPQAFTHIGLINAALRLQRRTAKGEKVAGATPSVQMDD